MYNPSMHRVGKDLVAASATPLVLGILAEGESYGYAILKRVSQLSGGHLQWTDGMRGGPHPLDRFSSQLRWNPGS